MSSNAPEIFKEFVKRYGPSSGEDCIIRFVRDQLHAHPDAWQEDVMREVARGERLISIRSCHGPGKTAVAAWIIVYQQVCRFPQKTVCTAPTGGQLYDALFAEVQKWMGCLPPVLQGLFTIKESGRIELAAKAKLSFASFRTARNEQPEALQGIHCEGGFVLLVVDEGSGVGNPIYEAAAGSMSGHNCTTLLLSNPVRTSGFFFDTHHKLKHMWCTHHITGVPGTAGTYSSRVAPAFVTDIIARYGRDSNAYRVRALGEFPRSDLDTIIPFEAIEAAKGRDIIPHERAPWVWGLDVARYGDDDTVLLKRRANTVPDPPLVWHGLNTMQVAGKVKSEWDATPEAQRPKEILVDVIGYGAGVADRLRELGLPVRDVNVSELPALNSTKYHNLRTELWFAAREWFLSRECSIYDDKHEGVDREKGHILGNELVQTKYGFQESSGKMIAESKKKAKARGVPSPNHADALILTFASFAVITVHGGKSQDWSKPIRRNIKGIV
ncbi:hypothetical protein LCGC14_2236720 [marine sediment metagenome]|uniref:Terminase large subunit gp17-like C-terminal domain-containing protein n=1 Tax=marine sediment metagenome TaxID=412755 RepID=A0A0F9DU81_9ZZZZ